jgi:hypothetical protein
MRIADQLLIGVFAAGYALAGLAADVVGEVDYSRGVLTGQIDDEQPRIIARGVALHNGETLNTGSRAFAIISLEDGTRMTLRPNTTFKIEDVNQTQGSENALMSLIRGGLRAITGRISKLKPNAFRINTSVATIGIRGTEFDARLCEGNECQAEEDASGQSARRESRVIGRVALLRGNVSAREDGQPGRILSVGAAVYERDQIQTASRSFTVIAFNDKTRVTLSPQSAFRIEEHEFKPEEPGENNSFMSFLRGGMRLVTGVIGQLNPNAFRVGTPTVTIGIRGTGFDLVCQGACVDENALRNPVDDTLIGRFINLFMRPAFAQNASNGMYAKAWRGTVLLYLRGDTVVLPNGRTAFMRDNASPPRLVADIPPLLRSFQGAPRPDRVEVPEDFFSEAEPTGIEPGLYVKVDAGDVAVQGADGNTIHLGSGEALRAGALGAERLGFVPAFQKFNRYPKPSRLDAGSQQRMDLLGERGADSESLECTVR